MNTPAHAIINLLLLPQSERRQHGIAIIIGALLPDAPMLIFYLWSRLIGVSETQIWKTGYFHPTWQAVFDGFHSFPLLAVAALCAWLAKLRWLTLLFASMFLHACFDFPLHHNDAHHHFFPFSDWQFQSPVSYWNPAYYGQYIGALELLTVVAGSAWLMRRHRQLRLPVAAVLMLYLGFWAFAALVWM